MNEWMKTYDAVFFISITTIVSGAFIATLKFCHKSKCEEFNLCGLISVKRRVDLEVEEELKQMDSTGASKEEKKDDIEDLV